MHTSKTISK